MKRIAAIAGFALILLLAVWTIASPQTITNALTAATLQSRAWVFSALQTFGAGATVSAGDLTVTTGNVVLSAGGATVDGKDISGQAVFKNEANTGAGSLHFDGGVGASAGNKVNYEGSAGDSYMLRTVATASLDTYKDGALAGQNRGTHWILADCPTDIQTLEFGAVCKSISTGKLYYRGTLEAVP